MNVTTVPVACITVEQTSLLRAHLSLPLVLDGQRYLISRTWHRRCSSQAPSRQPVLLPRRTSAPLEGTRLLDAPYIASGRSRCETPLLGWSNT